MHHYSTSKSNSNDISSNSGCIESNSCGISSISNFNGSSMNCENKDNNVLDSSSN